MRQIATARNSIIFAPTSVGCKTFWVRSDVLALEMPAFEYLPKKLSVTPFIVAEEN